MRHSLQISFLVGVLLSSCNQKSGAPSDSSKSDNAQQSTEEFQPPVVSSNSLVDRFLSLIATIASRANELNREKDRRGKLRQELLGHAVSSCALEKEVRTLEFFIDGSSRSDFDVSDKYQNAKDLPQDAKANSFTFIVGEIKSNKSISFTNDEMKESLFVPGGRKLFKPELKLKIGDLKQIKIVRASTSYKITDYCAKSGDKDKKIAGCTALKEVKETGRVEMTSIRIMVNGYLLYEKPLKHVFGKDLDKEDAQNGASSGLSWSDDNLQISDSFNQLIQLNDCSQL